MTTCVLKAELKIDAREIVRESHQAFRVESSTSQPAIHQLLLCWKILLCPIWIYESKMPWSLSSKVSNKNIRENQIKTKWEWSGRHNENNMECEKCKWREKVLWWGENFPRVLVGEMDVKPSGLIVTLGGDWGVQTPWELLPFKL